MSFRKMCGLQSKIKPYDLVIQLLQTNCSTRNSLPTLCNPKPPEEEEEEKKSGEKRKGRKESVNLIRYLGQAGCGAQVWAPTRQSRRCVPVPGSSDNANVCVLLQCLCPSAHSRITHRSGDRRGFQKRHTNRSPPITLSEQGPGERRGAPSSHRVVRLRR